MPERSTTPAVTDTALQIASFCRDMCAVITADPSGVWGKITAAAVRLLDPVDHAGITVIDDGGGVQPRAATDRLAETLEDIQKCFLQGPGIDAVRTQQPQIVIDVVTDGRWPTFVANAGALPVRSLASFPLTTGEHTRSALTLAAEVPNAFAGDAGALAAVFACNAAVISETAHRERRLHHTLTNRDTVGQAKGLLMERFGIDSAAAFAMLTQLSERHQQSVVTVARHLIRRAGGQAARRASR
ncbi:hypothetical protein AU196_17060 [Mycobacterium sp. IS-1742]|uniref:GAF and ANTAR domain-containing protein n=1 Tax=Mycobacterium sp. IS-1742 TaxID=1772285 RepID=UPI00073FF450|nr:GAF and ANTAR domain-containing protein [Mycobacterium sp. IS-1742]KUI26470.1 hypothetical protein AU196_17060 [Mycobacterium sp. IS-1742]